MRALRAAIPLALALGAGARSAVAEERLEVPVAERRLGNGLRVLVHEDRSIPNVAVYVWWRVGSRNERTGVTGLAHFFEHMMFTGGARFGGEFDPRMEAAGGSNNAFTTNDVTVYQDWLPVSALPLVLDMEADRMGGMVFRPEVVESERGVVASEWRLNMEEPAERMRVQLHAAAYVAHPYQWPVLGWMEDIRNWKLADLEEFFRVNYAPNNATIVIAGAVDAEDVFAEVDRRMGAIPRQPERPPVHTQEPPQEGERRVVVLDAEAGLPQVMAAWHIPATDHADFPAIEVVEALLLHGDSSRLHQLMVEREAVCLGVAGGWQGHQFDPSLFTVELVMRDGESTSRGEELVYDELARLAAGGPAPRELEKVKNQLRAQFVRRLKTIDGKAELIGESETFFGGWRNLAARLERIEAVSADDVKRVLAAYFGARNRTVCTLVIPVADDEPAGEREDGR